MNVETEHGTHDPRDDNDGCAICRAHRSTDPNDAKVVEDWWRAYDRRAGRREVMMTPRSQSFEDAFTSWATFSATAKGQAAWLIEQLMRDCFTAGWTACLAVQEQAHADQGDARRGEGDNGKVS